MYKTVGLVVALLMIAPLSSGQVDSIRIPGTSGCTIVELVLERIDNSIRQLVGLYQPSSDEASVASAIRSVKEFLRRIAAVESDYGRADHTYRDNYHGGIWQVDEADFNGHPDKVFSFLEMHPGRRIDLLDTYIITLSWMDLRQPLYSGFAAMLQLFLSGEQVPDAEDVTGQADFWIRHYHTNTGGKILTRENFTAVADLGCAIPCQSYPDIVFVIDSSGSIGASHFQQALSFTADLVSEFRIGKDFTRIGVITYNSDVITSEQIELNRFYDASELSAAIRGIQYTGGGTRTGEAIQYATDTMFNTNNGARNDGRSKVGIVLTDGRSGDDVIEPSNAAHNASINLIAIGIGDGIDENELLAIAGSPEQVYLVDMFVDLPSFSASIETASCLSAVSLEVGDTLSTEVVDGEVRYLSLTTRPGDNYTLHINVMDGGVVVYGSLVTAMPGPDAYDFKLNISAMGIVATDVLIIVPKLNSDQSGNKTEGIPTQSEADEESVLVMAIVGVSDNASLDLNITEGDNRRYGDLAVSLNEEEREDGTAFYVCEAKCTCELAYVTMTTNRTGMELPTGSILNQIDTRRVEVILPSTYNGPLYCVIATPGVFGSEVFSSINITGKCNQHLSGAEMEELKFEN